MTLEISYSGDPTEDRPEAEIETFDRIKPFSRTESETGANSNHQLWPFTFSSSRWFVDGEIIRLEPGEYTNFHTHRQDLDGPYERYYRVFSGTARVRTEYWDTTLERFDSLFIPPDCAYQLGNPGTESLWLGGFASVGEKESDSTHTEDPSTRPGALEEYNRILAAREQRDLPIPADSEISYDGNIDESWPEASVRRFDRTVPVTFHEAEETGCNADRQEWYTLFPESKWFYAGVMLRLDPGEYLDFHTHRENEGPYEELYWVIDGKAHLQTEYWDTTLSQFDCAFFPTGCAHNFGNAGTEPLWFEAWMSHGGDAPSDVVPDHMEPVERPGAVEEYKRIMAVRKERGLPLPPHVSVEISEE